MLKISDAASLALHTASLLAERSGVLVTTHEIASRLGVSRTHLSKVLQRLARAGLVTSLRGPQGGFALARPAAEVTLLEIYQAIEGPLAPAECLLGSRACGGRCMMGDLVKSVNDLVGVRLAATTVSDAARAFDRGANDAEKNSPD